MTVTTPNIVSEQILDFCSEITGDYTPVLLNVKPDSQAELNQCYYNVRDCIETEGGSQVYGWIIWEFPAVYLEAEHHSVWMDQSGNLLDITPKSDAESQILFLQDNTAGFNFSKPNWRDNRRKSVHSDPAVGKYLKEQSKLTRFIIHNSRPKGRDREMNLQGEKLVRRYERLQHQVRKAQIDFSNAISS